MYNAWNVYVFRKILKKTIINSFNVYFNYSYDLIQLNRGVEWFQVLLNKEADRSISLSPLHLL